METKGRDIKAIIGLGNPGKRFERTRHNIGFMIIDALAQESNSSWQEKDIMHSSSIRLHDKDILLIKPMTYMNNSGDILPFLLKKGIKAEHIIVIHDELELAFGACKIRSGGSAKGHNGLRSIIEVIGKEFMRFSFGIGRPARKEEVPDYVLEHFKESNELPGAIAKAVESIKELFQ